MNALPESLLILINRLIKINHPGGRCPAAALVPESAQT
jgi:hypothetical protein